MGRKVAVADDGAVVITERSGGSDAIGRTLWNFSGNDYLGLASHPRLVSAAVHAIEKYGTGAGASRLVSGHLLLHQQCEERFAAFKHAQAALLCPTGYMANLAVISSLVGPGDLIFLDKLNHASLIDAAQSCGATVRVFGHLDYAKLQRLLQTAKPREVMTAAQPFRGRKLIVTDSVFSMDGDVADLSCVCELAKKYDAIVMVDEAHGTGVLGKTGAGLCELQGVADKVDIVVSTGSKALGSLGGIITAKRLVIDWLINKARSFIYTTAVPPSQAASLLAALDVIQDEPWRRQRVLQLATTLREQLQSRGWQIPPTNVVTPIVPLIVGSAERAILLSEYLKSQGILAPAIRPPTVAPASSRVRLTLRADFTDADLDHLIDVLTKWSD